MTVNFTPAKYKLLKHSYKKAIDTNQDQFVFEGQDILTSYAKYLLEYLEGKYARLV